MKRCETCGTDNDHSGAFCRNCGGRLPVHGGGGPAMASAMAGETESRSPALPSSQGGRCPACGVEAPAGTSFCRGCGASLRSQTPDPHPEVRRGGPRHGSHADPWASGPTEPRPATGDVEQHRAGVVETVNCPRCDTRAPAGHMFCPSCGAQLPTLAGAPTPDVVREVTAGRERFKPPADVATVADGSVSPVVRSGPAQAPKDAWGRLVSVNRDGSDGPGYFLTGEFVDVGTGPATIRVTGDPHVAPRHLRLERRSGAVTAVPLDELNGVLWRLREPTEVLSGTIVLLGRELCRIDLVAPSEREVRGLVQHGTSLFASPPRRPWARLSHLWSNGAVGDVRHFFSDEIVIGREEGDIIFADDEFLSRRHAAFRRRDNRCILEDLGSSNGTFVRLDAPTLVSTGDFLRVGDHMFRFEAPTS